MSSLMPNFIELIEFRTTNTWIVILFGNNKFLNLVSMPTWLCSFLTKLPLLLAVRPTHLFSLSLQCGLHFPNTRPIMFLKKLLMYTML